MSLDAHPASPSDTRSLASRLVPFIEKACPDRLGHLTWFKADWQRSGAATARATLTGDDDVDAPVVIKLPVGQTELIWTRRLQTPDDSPGVVPRLYASGESLGGYDLAWLVIERYAHGPLGRHWAPNHVARIADAAARFHAAAAAFPVDEPPKREDWPVLVREGAGERQAQQDQAPSAVVQVAQGLAVEA